MLCWIAGFLARCFAASSSDPADEACWILWWTTKRQALNFPTFLGIVHNYLMVTEGWLSTFCCGKQPSIPRLILEENGRWNDDDDDDTVMHYNLTVTGSLEAQILLYICSAPTVITWLKLGSHCLYFLCVRHYSFRTSIPLWTPERVFITTIRYDFIFAIQLRIQLSSGFSSAQDSAQLTIQLSSWFSSAHDSAQLTIQLSSRFSSAHDSAQLTIQLSSWFSYYCSNRIPIQDNQIYLPNSRLDEELWYLLNSSVISSVMLNSSGADKEMNFWVWLQFALSLLIFFCWSYPIYCVARVGWWAVFGITSTLLVFGMTMNSSCAVQGITLINCSHVCIVMCVNEATSAGRGPLQKRVWRSFVELI